MKNLEIATWQDLATIYMKLGSLPDAEICTEKAKSIEFYSPGSWHTTGKYPLSKAVHERKEKQFFLRECTSDSFDVWYHEIT